MQQFTPFGCRYEGDNYTIKLRFKEEKFIKSGLNEHGNYRHTRNGYVIFEISLPTNSLELKQVLNKMNSAR